MDASDFTKAFDDIVLDHGTVTLPAQKVASMRGQIEEAYRAGGRAADARWKALLGLAVGDLEPKGNARCADWGEWNLRMQRRIDALRVQDIAASFDEMANSVKAVP